MQQQKISTVVGTLIIIIMALTAGAFVFKIDKFDMENLYQPVKNQIKNKKTDKTVCTMEAKLCPDGTYVSRSGPNCEFAVCPGELTIDTADWKTYQNPEFGFEMKYPATFSEPTSPVSSRNTISTTSEQDSGLSFQVQFFLDAFGPINNLEEAFKISTRGNSYKEMFKKDIVFNGAPAIEYAGVIRLRFVHAVVGVLDGKYFDLVVESKYYSEADQLFQKVFANFGAIGNKAADWQTYRNEKYGYSIKIPIEVASGKMKILEDGDITFITAEKDIQYKEILNNIKSSKNDYEKTWGITWALLAKKVSNDSEIDAFIKKSFGDKCNLGEKVASKQAGVFDVRIDLSNWDPENGCFVNYVHSIMYSPAKNVIVTWDIGQAVNFELPNGDAADQEMGESFQFVN